jgi:hypothetical protein
MHHVYDEAPTEEYKKEYLPATEQATDSIYHTHFGKRSIDAKYDKAQTDVSQYRLISAHKFIYLVSF